LLFDHHLKEKAEILQRSKGLRSKALRDYDFQQNVLRKIKMFVIFVYYFITPFM
jgi:hypothetical protein